MVTGSLLPQSVPDTPKNTQDGPKTLFALPRRYSRALLTCTFVFMLILFFKFSSVESARKWVPKSFTPHEPPHYYEFHDYERNLPQHAPAAPEAHAKFLWAKNHVGNSGWGNFMQELIWNSHLAYAANRSFVFYNYTWFKGLEREFRVDDAGNVLPNRYPLSTMISGPTIGGPYPSGVDVPRAVSREFYFKKCPKPTVVHTDQVHSVLPEGGTDALVQKWVEILKGIDDPCVEIDPTSRSMFDLWVFGSTRVLGGWPELSKSPILTQFGWSDLVVAAFETNKRIFLEPSERLLPVTIPSFPVYPSHDQSAPLRGLLALHLRRGDFSHHCNHFFKWGSSFNGFNQFPSLLDKLTPSGDRSDASKVMYFKACYPTIEQIVEKVREVRNTVIGKTLDRVYLMTNADDGWLSELEKALRREAKWKVIATKRDLQMTPETKYVAQAFDMMIGQRAQVFIGNGFSSLTSNVVMLRMARRFPPESTRFW